MLKIDFVYVEEWKIQQKVSDMNWREIGEIYNYLLAEQESEKSPKNPSTVWCWMNPKIDPTTR